MAFLKLGVTSFGGPVAHLGYFRTEFVERRKWLSEAAYADLVGLCQFLPGPASSQTGFALGLMRAGWRGGLAAWVGFTLPSAALLVLFAMAAPALSHSATGAGLLHGLQLTAVAVVAQAVSGMARSLCPDRPRAAIALVALALASLTPVAIGQIIAIAAGAIAGLAVLRRATLPAGADRIDIPVSRAAGTACLAVFAALLAVPPLMGSAAAVFDAFYRSGALVFGGGHVVLPLLRDAVVTPGWVSEDSFVAGYGAAQAVPGPLFTFAAYLGTVMRGGAGGAILPLIAIFLPGFLLLVAALPFWSQMRSQPGAQAAMRGANAAVVGVLGAALYNPVWTSAVHIPADFVIACISFCLLTIWRTPPLLIVIINTVAGMSLATA